MGAGNEIDKDAYAKRVYARRSAYQTKYGAIPTSYNDDGSAAAKAGNDELTEERFAKGTLGDEYIDPTTGRPVGGLPAAPDLTDDLLKQTRTNMAMRLQVGRNRQGAMGTGALGSLDLSRPVLGGS